ncbi:MAG: helix-turn-helix domain-containing protein [Achromobacter mucicolens]|jgi:y4mF family transcriptional regulator|uniref:helix-turn-helix domain-containing protein n=1 Tax=Achromobacter mucicolens TaxID=1389922 RepID=UPI0015CC0855|nr:helix-turn-helix domain-containing protein [Achromobacter mucicolens]WBX87838.1 helix-turn-helix domain-containing protein [Achromobacter mucicolens]
MTTTRELDAIPAVVSSSTELGALIRSVRRRQGLLQVDLAGLGNSGNRFVVDLERGKPTVQLQKVFDMLDLLGLEVEVRWKRPRFG